MFAVVLHGISNWLHQIVCIRLRLCQHPLLSYKQMKLRGPRIRDKIQWSHWHFVCFVFASIIFTPISGIENSAGSAQFVCVFIFAVCLAALLTSLLLWISERWINAGLRHASLTAALLRQVLFEDCVCACAALPKYYCYFFQTARDKMETKPRLSLKSLASPEEKHFDNLTSPLFRRDFHIVSVHVHTSIFLFETAQIFF